MNRLLLIRRAADAVTTTMGYVGGVLFLLISFFITIDALGRRFLGITSGMTDELGGYTLAIAGSWGFAFCLRSGGHVRIDLLLPRMSPRLRATVDTASLLALGVYTFVIARYAWQISAASREISARSMGILGAPIWIPQALLAFGFGMMLLQVVLTLAFDRASLAAKDEERAAL